jgi:hypothetical protein
VFVACDDRVIVLDAAHDGSVLDTVQTGAGVDNIDFEEETRTLFAAAADVGVLTIAGVSDVGRLQQVRTVSTARGVRSVVAGSGGDAYAIDPYGGRILRVRRRAALAP